MDDFSVLDGELQSKIQENAQLHLDFEEQKVTSRQLLQRLENQLTQTRSESVARIKELQAIIQSERQKNTELIEEKNQLEVKLIEYLAEMQRHKAKETQQIVVECPSTNDVCAEAHAKMMLFVEKYMNAEKRSMSFEVECKMLENRLEFVQDSLRKAKRNNESLQTSVQNYESQLSAMSEYVASLDDKIIRQNDEIETLRQLHQLKVTSNYFIPFHTRNYLTF